MTDVDFAAALEEGTAEEWAAAHSEIRQRLARLRETGALGESVADGFREFFRLGFLRGYHRALKRLI